MQSNYGMLPQEHLAARLGIGEIRGILPGWQTGGVRCGQYVMRSRFGIVTRNIKTRTVLIPHYCQPSTNKKLNLLSDNLIRQLRVLASGHRNIRTPSASYPIYENLVAMYRLFCNHNLTV
jgi:hypothetical protein